MDITLLRRVIVYYDNLIESNLSLVGIIFHWIAREVLFTLLIFQIRENTDDELVGQNAHITYDQFLAL